jgi:hypothetical protein
MKERSFNPKEMIPLLCKTPIHPPPIRRLEARVFSAKKDKFNSVVLFLVHNLTVTHLKRVIFYIICINVLTVLFLGSSEFVLM